MKSLTCKQLGGACDVVLSAETFDEIAEIAKNHGADMAIKQDAAHLSAINDMMEMMQNPEEMQSWMQDKKALFESQLTK